MKKAVRGILIAGICVAGVAVVLLGGWLVLTRMSFPKVRGTVKLEGISAPVTILRDRYGVPHIYARTSKDLFFAEGYVHAQDRFWQMEFCRRIGDGRLSELFGKSQLQTDIFLRTIGIGRIARQEYEQADQGVKDVLDAYAAGVNAYIHDRSPARLGLEFAVLNLTGAKTKIEPWTPANTLAWAKMMAWSGEDKWESEVMMTHVLHTLGTRGISGLFTRYQDKMPYTVSNEEMGVSGKSAHSLQLIGNDTGFGSNGWVVAGSRTTSGKPMLANDMHLSVQIPSVWYEVGLHGIDENGRVGRTKECPFDLYGYSMPGAPGAVTGHNDRIAWGFTYLHGDTQDLYLEKINPENPDQYLVDGKWRNMQSIYEEIPVRKAEEPYRLRVRTTRHGPIITDHGENATLAGFTRSSSGGFPEDTQLTAVSFRWPSLSPANVLKAVLQVDQAENYTQFRDAMRNWTSPALNVVYADVDGNIAYQTIGRIPVRRNGRGKAPAPGWTSRFEWTGYIPFDDLPHSLNPKKGYIVTSNNPPAGPDYPYFLGMEQDYGFRARRIVEMIESHDGPFEPSDFRRMQMDDLSETSLEVCAALKNLDLHQTPLEVRIAETKTASLSDRQRRELDRREAQSLARMQAARDMLVAWDGRMSGDSSAAALYATVFGQLVTEVFRDQLPDSEWPMKVNDRAANAIHYLLADPNALLWDDTTTPDRETRDEILVRSFRRGYAQVVEKLGEDPKNWRWDKLHTITFVNQTLGKSGISPIEKIFNRGPYPIGSGPTGVNKEEWDPEKPFNVRVHPSMRMVIDMGNIAEAVSVLPTGQSGHPASPHYDDFIKLWMRGDYHPALWDRKDIERSSRQRLVLSPQ